MAETDGLDRGAAQHRAGEHRHRVRVVQKPGVRSDLFDVARKVEHDRDRPQRPEDAADAECVGDGLAQAELLRDLEVDDGGGFIAAH